MLYFKCCTHCGHVDKIYGDSKSDMVEVDECDNCRLEKSKRNPKYKHLQDVLDVLNSYSFEYEDDTLSEFGHTHDFTFEVKTVDGCKEVWIKDNLGNFGETLGCQADRMIGVLSTLFGIRVDGTISMCEEFQKHTCSVFRKAVALDFGVTITGGRWETPEIFVCMIPEIDLPDLLKNFLDTMK